MIEQKVCENLTLVTQLSTLSGLLFEFSWQKGHSDVSDYLNPLKFIINFDEFRCWCLTPMFQNNYYCWIKHYDRNQDYKLLTNTDAIKDPNKSNTQKYFRHSNVKRYELALLRSGYFVYFSLLYSETVWTEQFFLFPCTFNEAILLNLVPNFGIQSTINGAILFVPLISYGNSSKFSLPISIGESVLHCRIQ